MRIVQAAAAIAASVAALPAGGALSLLYDVASEQGRQAERLSQADAHRLEIAKDAAERHAQLQAGIDMRFDALGAKIDALAQSMRADQLDLGPMLAQIGVIPFDYAGMEAHVVGDTVWLFPQTAGAEEILIQAGYKREQVSQTLSGYRAAPVSLMLDSLP
ncbi:MAG: hypothetical protein AAF192_18400 [Pseudomonadota bacterium]